MFYINKYNYHIAQQSFPLNLNTFGFALFISK